MAARKIKFTVRNRVTGREYDYIDEDDARRKYRELCREYPEVSLICHYEDSSGRYGKEDLESCSRSRLSIDW